MSDTASELLITLALFGGMLLFLEMGRRLGVRRLARDPKGAHLGTNAVDGAVFALLGLLIAFTFSGAASRFDERRQLIVEESNYIGTAYRRLDLFPPAAQPTLRDLFRRYVDSRIELYRKWRDTDAAKAEQERALKLQREIWSTAVAASRMEGAQPQASMLVFQSLNQMIDVTNTRARAAEMHPPGAIYVLLFVLAIAGALFAGYGMAGSRTRSWTHMIGFGAAIATAIYVIMDLEYPRHGMIRLDDFDKVLVDVRAEMR
ncbi:MAG: DUF4239 domain-containing protein [Casimicrobiaceae bacterium]